MRTRIYLYVLPLLLLPSCEALHAYLTTPDANGVTPGETLVQAGDAALSGNYGSAILKIGGVAVGGLLAVFGVRKLRARKVAQQVEAVAGKVEEIAHTVESSLPE